MPYPDSYYTRRVVKNYRSRPIKLNPVKVEKSRDNSALKYGSRNICDSKKPFALKIFWICALCFCMTPCLVHVSMRVQHFLDDPVSVDVIMQDLVTIKFPAIVLCTNEFVKLLRSKWKYCYDENVFKPNCRWKDVGINVTNTANTTERVKDLSKLNVDKLLLTEYRNFFDRSNGTVENMAAISTITTLWGECIVMIPNNVTEYKGPNTWIKMSWNTTELINNIDNAKDDKVFVYADDDNYINSSYHKLVLASETLASGEEHVTSITARQFYAVNRRGNPCIDKASHEECLNLCYEDYVCGTIKCRLPFIRTSCNDKKDCVNLDDTIHSFTTADSCYTSFKPKTCDCKRPCEHRVYKTSTNSKKNSDSEETIVKLLYSDNTLEIFKEKVIYTISELLSEIGGIVGLYLGVCFLTIFDAIESIIARSLITRQSLLQWNRVARKKGTLQIKHVAVINSLHKSVFKKRMY